MAANIDTRGITKEMEGKRLRIIFSDGEDAEIKLNWVMIYDCHEDCNGFVYHVISTNQPEKYTTMPAEASYWGRFENIVSIKHLGD